MWKEADYQGNQAERGLPTHCAHRDNRAAPLIVRVPRLRFKGVGSHEYHCGTRFAPLHGVVQT